MRNLVLVASLTSALLSPAAVAAAGPAGAAPGAVVSDATPVASIQEEVFCAIVRFLKGGWAGRQTDCSF